MKFKNMMLLTFGFTIFTSNIQALVPTKIEREDRKLIEEQLTKEAGHTIDIERFKIKQKEDAIKDIEKKIKDDPLSIRLKTYLEKLKTEKEVLIHNFNKGVTRFLEEAKRKKQGIPEQALLLGDFWY